MIFSKFFNTKPKWQNKNSNIRIEAINHLNPSIVEDKKILEQLVNNDGVEIVRRAALIQLSSFDSYLIASNENSVSTIKQFAHKQIVKMLLGDHNITLTSTQKRDLLVNAPNYLIKKEQLEAWMYVEQDPELVKEIFTHLAKPQLLFTLFNKTLDESIQLFLLEQVNEIPILEKLQIKGLNATINTLIKNKIAALVTLAEKPIKLRKSLQLLLSKLLALKNINDYESVLIKRQDIENQWQSLQIEFDILAESEKQIFIEKHQDIIVHLDKAFAVKAEKYQQEQIAKQIQIQQQQLEQNFNTEINSLKQDLVTAVFENNLEPQTFLNTLGELSNKVNNSCLNDNAKLTYQNTLNHLTQKFEHLSEISQSVSDATQLISKISELALPDSLASFTERYQIFKQWLKDWSLIEKQSFGLLPKSIIDAYQEIKQRWQKGCEQYLKQQNQTFIHTRKICSDIKRLLEKGKYNACFGLYKKMQQQILLLSVSQQQKLQRDVSFIEMRMSEVSDWEHYIATPKKQELLLLIQALVEQPCDNPNEQADKVKQYRKQWNLLGHADDEIEQSLNEQFNDYSEQAFAPCRTFYAEQEKIREQNHQNRKLLIIEASKLADKVLCEQPINAEYDFKSLENKLNQLTQQWQNTGEVERTIYKKLVIEFEETLMPVKKVIFNQHAQNAIEKKQLIKQVEKLLIQIELPEANIEQIISATKSIQQQWRAFGYAGAKQENKLWQSFRKINDEIFTKRDQNKQASQLLVAEQEQQFLDDLALLTKQLQGCVSEPLLADLLQRAQNLHNDILTTKPVLKPILSKVELLVSSITQQISLKKSEEKQRHWQTLFNLLKKMAKGEFSQTQLSQQPLFEQLTNTWQKRIVDVNNNLNMGDRINSTLELEIFANISSPVELTQQRMAVQVSLMQEQMTSAHKPNLEESLIKWLQLGKLTKQDFPLIERIEKIFVSEK